MYNVCLFLILGTCSNESCKTGHQSRNRSKNICFSVLSELNCLRDKVDVRVMVMVWLIYIIVKIKGRFKNIVRGSIGDESFSIIL